MWDACSRTCEPSRHKPRGAVAFANIQIRARDGIKSSLKCYCGNQDLVKKQKEDSRDRKIIKRESKVSV